MSAAAARLDVSIARAQIDVARIFPNPTLSGGLASVDISGAGSPTVTNVSLYWPIELFGQAGARVNVALEGHRLAESNLEVFLQALRADAADAFVDALHARLVLSRKQATLASLERLVVVNEQRFNAGDVGEIVVVQSRVEAERFRGSVYQAIGEVRAADEILAVYMGSAAGQRAFAPRGDLAIPPRHFDVAALLASARQHRPDLRAQQISVEQTQRLIDLANANRMPGVGVGVGWNHTFGIGRTASPFNGPDYDTLGASVSVTIPLSNVYRGDVDVAEREHDQSERRVQAGRLVSEVEVRRALARYESAVDQLEIYRGPLLQDAERVLESVLYEYQRGAATLLQVLDAQRTVDEVYVAYYDALGDHAHALVALEHAAGIWDLDF
jgi:cobalt-zinc-cadmium efflux system outer membrane protein